MADSVENLNSGTKKRGRPKHLKAIEIKKTRYCDTDPNLKNFKQLPRPCNHDSKSFMCNKVDNNDIMQNRIRLYCHEKKEAQDKVLCHFISAEGIKRNRPKDGTKPKSVSLNFFLKTSSGMKPVCKSFFCFSMGIPKSRVTRIGKVIHEGRVPKENRGGDRISKKYSSKRQSMRNFVNGLPCTESHYGRNKSKRVYLSGNLNVSKLCKIYNNSVNNENMRVTFPFFYKIFTTEFNIGFQSPAADACTLCIRLKNEIKSNCGNEEVVQNLRIQLRIHKIRANAFYDIMKQTKTDESCISFAFDLQQVHPLPKTPIQEAFYSRQIGFYTFCCVDVDSKHPVFYTWSEDQASRGSTEIGSALLHHLRNLNLDENVRKLFLFCDGCAGQNRNAHIVHTLCYWLTNESPEFISEIQVTFPVRGHSFLPADRAFGRAEKVLKKNAVLSTREDYVKLYKEIGVVNALGIDWPIYNIKELGNVYSKIKGISDAKRVIISKHKSRCPENNTVTSKVKFFCNYKFASSTEMHGRSIVKKNKKEESLVLTECELKHPISNEKKKDVSKLLSKHFGEDWKNLQDLQWYIEILNQEDNEQNNTSQDETIICDCLTEDCGLHI